MIIKPEKLFGIGDGASLQFEDPTLGIWVGRLGRDMSDDLVGAKVIGTKNSMTGTHFIVLDNETIDDLIALLERLRRS